MPEEQEGELGEAYAWKQLLRLDPLLGLTLFSFLRLFVWIGLTAFFVGPYLPLTNAGLYDKEIFFIMWKPLTSCINSLLEVADEGALGVKLQAIRTLKSCALVAASYRLTNHFDIAVLFSSFLFRLFSHISPWI